LAQPPERGATTERARPGRPSSGARERILAAALEVLKDEGYSGLTTAKVAARSGQNKALISYHFGSKQGLVAEVARSVSGTITEELLQAIGNPRNVRGLARGLIDGVTAINARDEGLPRMYFDLSAQAIVDPEVRSIIGEMKAGYRAVLRRELARVTDGPRSSAQAEAAAVFMVASLEGLMLDQLERGETHELKRARAMFVDSVVAALAQRR
jgi:AcrR family transcriptional regulator